MRKITVGNVKVVEDINGILSERDTFPITNETEDKIYFEGGYISKNKLNKITIFEEGRFGTFASYSEDQAIKLEEKLKRKLLSKQGNL